MPNTTRSLLGRIFIIFFCLFTLSNSSTAQITANFSATPTSGCSPQIVNFTDLSTGNPIEWIWDLGNGTTSVLQHPSATYFSAGQYTVKLVVRDASGNRDSLTRTQYINIFAIPVVNFTATPRSGCVPLHAQFTDQSSAGTSTISSWLWDFGDGTTGAVQHPSHTYATAGNYNVTLQVTTSAGCSKTLTKSNYIQASNGVTANFTNTAPTGCRLPVTINFTNTSTGPGTLSYSWNFGDGGSSTAQNPTHTYTSAGSFTVTLTVVSTTGCSNSVVKTNVVVINFLTASFTAPPNGCVNDSINFANTTNPAPTSVLWNFGDGSTSTASNPVKAYALPGTYIIKLTAFKDTCVDSTTRTITISTKPTASFSATNRTACKPPLTVNFTNTSSPLATYFWDFGDGATSGGTNPSHTYTSYGSFTVKLFVTNFTGCSDSMVIADYIQILEPVASINNLPQSNCSPLTWTFSSTVNSPDPVVSYFWDLGDGSTSTAATPTNTYLTGSYDITLIVTTLGGCKDTVFIPAGIVADDKPTANFSANPRDVCAKIDVNFIDLSSANVTRWLWDFGDGGTSTVQNPSHHYEDTGYFSIRLIAWNNNCADTITFIDYVHISPPIANFTATFDCATPRTFNFTDASIGPDEWHWDFGDGTTSTAQHNIHTFPGPGTYTVQLLVINHTSGCDDLFAIPVRIVEEVANFDVFDSVICKNTAASFTAIGNTPGTIIAYDWDFGDGQTGTGLSIAHTYTNAGFYSVTLVITDVSGCKDTLIKSQYIRVNGPTAAFTIPNGGNCLNSTVTFIDNSVDDGINPITTWIWNFGDGSVETFTAPPFSHFYTASGTYLVTLTAIDSEGCSDSTQDSSIIVISSPLASFNPSALIACPDFDLSFTNTSSGQYNNYVWDFADGSTSIDIHPVHRFMSEGNFNVMLSLVDVNGCRDTTYREIQITPPHASFTVSDTLSTCPPLIATFTNTSVNGNEITWDFGDGSTSTSPSPIHIYNNAGTYFAKLYVTGPGNNCVDSMVQKIVIRGPIGTFSYTPVTGCSPLSVNFTAITQDSPSFIWDFNDGSIITTPDSTISYVYTIPGAYLPKMIMVDPGGCQVPVQGLDTINVYGVKTIFGYDGLPRCDLGTIQFTDSSIINDASATYNWSFGDGGTSTLQNPSHFYAAAGQYNPQLIVTTNRGCTDTATLPVPVQIVASPQADFANAMSGCTPVSATFNAILLVPDTSAITWNWDLGNGNTSTLPDPPIQTYTTARVYDIQLIATNSTGCKDTVNKSFEVYPIPVIDASPDIRVCRGTPTQLTASGGDTYSWSPAAGLSCTTCPDPLATPDFNRRYYVTGSSAFGCSNSDSLDITVIQPFTMDNKRDDTICIGSTVRLFASGANSYEWSPSTGLSSIASSIPVASPKTTTTYRVVGSDAYGCFKDTGYTTIKVYPIPQIDAGKDITMKNGGAPITITPTISPDVNNTYWLTAPGILYSNTPSVTVQPKSTTEYTVEARNAGGCKSIDRITVFVLCDGANIFIPNTFSPNGSGQNDLFYPRGSGIFKIKLLRIFNRWGEVVFERVNFSPNDANAGWDGTVQGRKVNSDVYVYTAEILCENNTSIILNGNVALLR
ncbi:MAG: PKD domain-containing protein [Chitinophagaceae bacterium]|nr:PKD domain-containing protein [Chitinophagaceae bacterium]